MRRSPASERVSTQYKTSPCSLRDDEGINKPANEMRAEERLRMDNRILQAQLKDAEMENKLLKTEEVERRQPISGVRQEDYCEAIQYVHTS